LALAFAFGFALAVAGAAVPAGVAAGPLQVLLLLLVWPLMVLRLV
jgi:hypothetical protein